MRAFFFSAVVAIAAVSCVSCTGGRDYVAVSGYAQGGVYTVKFNISGVQRDAGEIKADIDSILLDIDNSVSGYNKGSVLSRFNAGEPVKPDAVFEKMYAYACLFYTMYDGLVDAASGRLFDMWGFGFTSQSMPDSSAVREALAVCGMDRMKMLMSFDGIRRADGLLYPEDLLAEPGSGEVPQLNFNAFAQGFSADLVADYLHSLGVKDMLVDIGEIFCEGRNPAGRPWAIGVDSPIDGNDTPGADIQGVHHCTPAPQGIVTSGNYRKFYVRDGKKYSHTIDPRTGYPVQHNLLSATVVADKSVVADAAATCCMVLGLEEAKAFLDRFGYEGYLLYEEGGRICGWHSSGFDITSR